MDLRDFAPLDFSDTLAVLSSWEGRTVHAVSSGHAPDEPLTHSQMVISGTLSGVQMVDNVIDRDDDSVAGFAVGQTPADLPASGFYISRSTFVRATPLPPPINALRLDFKDGYAIQVGPIDGEPVRLRPPR